MDAAYIGVFVGGGVGAEVGDAGDRNPQEHGEAGAMAEGDECDEAAAATGCVTSRALVVDEDLSLFDADGELLLPFCHCLSITPRLTSPGYMERIPPVFLLK
jgi:hypothetical protein